MHAPPETPSLALQLTHAGRTLDLALPPSSPLADLVQAVSDHFDLSPASIKLVVKGKKVALTPAERALQEALVEAVGAAAVAKQPLKALVVGTKRSELEALEADKALREKKHAAFLHHQAHASSSSRPSRSGIHTLSSSSSEDDPERYRFYDLQPFPPSVPQYQKRLAMLKRLAEDPAVKDVMRKHKFAVGVLTELHPLLQPTLLGLNTNAGQKVSLRLLTDSLDGTRSYLDVRRVLLHELAHNQFGPHDDDFKELNSLLNKEVAAFEDSPSFEAWDPATSVDSDDRQAHRLNEEQAENVWDKLKFGLEDEVDERRERMRKAAEERAKKAARG
ncbi:hypothetical protein JCM8097_007878 [Rhodosporidiobolus ruineniae]